METSKALKGLLEVADLIGMVEELMSSKNSEISPQTISGIKITLRNARHSVLSSHDSLAHGMVLKSRSSQESQMPGEANGTNESKLQFQRKDLRSSIDKFVQSE